MKQIDFENGTITQNIFMAAIPKLVAQVLSLLYNIVDRIYIARIPGVGTTALGEMCIRDIYWGGDAQREDRLTLLFNLILCELSSLQAEMAGGPGSNSMLEQVRQKIYSNPQVFFSASEMAAEFYICPRTLNNRFRDSCNPVSYTHRHPR